MADTTTVEVRTVTWKELNRRKEPGDSFDDVIDRLLEQTD
jgi:predicted CopG family antitoxin